MHARRPLLLVIAAALAFGAATPVAAAARVDCPGEAIITATSNLDVRNADGNLFIDFDFTGLHTICLADGTVDTATIAGHLGQRTGADGSVNVAFAEVLAYGDGTLEFRGQAVGSGGIWRSAVRTVGNGTGSLAGIHGQGAFWPAGPNVFVDTIRYVYPTS